MTLGLCASHCNNIAGNKASGDGIALRLHRAVVDHGGGGCGDGGGFGRDVGGGRDGGCHIAQCVIGQGAGTARQTYTTETHRFSRAHIFVCKDRGITANA